MTARDERTAGPGPLLTWQQSREVSRQVRALRRQAGLEQIAVDAAAGITSGKLQYLEGGRSRWRRQDAEKVAMVLGTSLARLLGEGEG